MTSLVGLILLFLFTIIFGKRVERVNIWTYLIVLLIAILQVCVVLFHLYTIEPPIPAI
jgi:hypothetical protein